MRLPIGLVMALVLLSFSVTAGMWGSKIKTRHRRDVPSSLKSATNSSMYWSTILSNNTCQSIVAPDGKVIELLPKLITKPSARLAAMDNIDRHLVCRLPDCYKKPCKHGQCEETIDGFNCVCSSGYKGDACDIGIKHSGRRSASKLSLTTGSLNLGTQKDGVSQQATAVIMVISDRRRLNKEASDPTPTLTPSSSLFQSPAYFDHPSNSLWSSRSSPSNLPSSLAPSPSASPQPSPPPLRASSSSLSSSPPSPKPPQQLSSSSPPPSSPPHPPSSSSSSLPLQPLSSLSPPPPPPPQPFRPSSSPTPSLESSAPSLESPAPSLESLTPSLESPTPSLEFTAPSSEPLASSVESSSVSQSPSSYQSSSPVSVSASLSTPSPSDFSEFPDDHYHDNSNGSIYSNWSSFNLTKNPNWTYYSNWSLY